MLQPIQPLAHPTPKVPMLVRELETANTLLDLHGIDSTETSTVPVEPENTVTTIELPDDSDAMDKIVGYCEEPNPLRKHDALKSNDAMDRIVSTQPDDVQPNVLNVETVTSDTQIGSVSAKQDVGLNVETMKLKACHVCVRPLENIVFEDRKPDPLESTRALPSGEHYTRSRTRKPAVRTSCIPRKASTGKQYEELSDTPSPKKRRPIPVKPSVSGPSVTHISAQKAKSPYPTRRLPSVPSNGDGDNTSESLDEPSLPNPKVPPTMKSELHPPRQRVRLQPKVMPLGKNTRPTNTYAGCAPIKVTVPVTLTRHHQKMHGILYCSVCKKAFNNPISLRRHEYSHKEKNFQCSMCQENFNFNSELKNSLNSTPMPCKAPMCFSQLWKTV